MSKSKSGGQEGFVVSVRPRAYKSTPQQERFREALAFCEIRKGMTREDLIDKMKNCIPEFFRKRKEEHEQ
jgi:hypothetical protein